MRNFFIVLASLVAIALFFVSVAYGATIFQPVQGGTGSSTLSGILIGNGTSPVRTLTIGSNLTLSGTTLSASGGGGGSGNVATSSTETQGFLSYWTSTGATPATLGKVATTSVSCTGNATCSAFTAIGSSPVTINVAAGTAASSTLLGDTNTWSGNNKFNNAITVAALSGLVGANSGLLYSFASSSLFGYTPLNPTRTINTTYPIQGGGDLSADRTISTAFSTTTNNIFSGTNLFTNASTTINGNATTTGTFFAGIASSTSLFGASLSTCNGTSFLQWSAGTFGCGTPAGGSSTFGTTSLSALWPIIYTQSSSLAQYSFGGLSTSTPAVLGNIPYFSGVNTFANVATSAATCSSGVSCSSFNVIGSAAPSITNTGVTSNVAGSGITVSGSTGAVTISALFGWTPQTYGNATGTVLSFPGFVSTASSTIVGNATTTGTQFAGIASSSQLYGAGLATCNSGNVLTWAAGIFGCVADQTAAGAANPFTWQSTYATIAAATTSPVWFQGTSASFFASSTAYFGSGGVGTSSIQVGGDQTAWTFGNFGVNNNFVIASATVLSLNQAFTIDKNLKVTVLQASTTDISARTAAFGGTATTSISAAGVITTPVPSALLVTNAGGVVSGYGGAAACTNQVVTAISALGATTCATVTNSMLTSSSITVNTLGSLTGGGAVSLGGSLNLTGISEFTFPNAFGAAAMATGTPAQFTGNLFASSTVRFGNAGVNEQFYFSGANGFLGLGTSTPWAQFSINPSNTINAAPIFAIGSSSATTLVVTNYGYVGIGTTTPFARLTLSRDGFISGLASSSIVVTQYNAATTTARTLDCRDSNTIVYAQGTAATTLTLAPMIGGQTCKVVVINGNGTAGAITWAVSGSQQLYWAGGTTPTQTTTANKKDVWSFIVVDSPPLSTTTPKTQIMGAMTANF